MLSDREATFGVHFLNLARSSHLGPYFVTDLDHFLQRIGLRPFGAVCWVRLGHTHTRFPPRSPNTSVIVTCLAACQGRAAQQSTAGFAPSRRRYWRHANVN